jgi:hypothetical protein
MALVYRNGRARYQRSVRRGGHVTTEYRGSGALAELAALLDADERAEALEQREAEAAERRALDDLEHALDEANRHARALAHEALERAGYHLHRRGTWRRRREP